MACMGWFCAIIDDFYAGGMLDSVDWVCAHIEFGQLTSGVQIDFDWKMIRWVRNDKFPT